MTSLVYMIDLSASWKKSVPAKVTDLFNSLNPVDIFKPKDLVAIKIHFGEVGNTAHIRPQFVRQVVDILKGLKAKPFLTDTNTLYVG
ncbi:MAG: DUF362 domain-containing protein, partial [Desulfomonilaceae bacterium]